MVGADIDGQQAKCRNCGKMIDRSHRVVEKAIENELHRFCSDRFLD